MFEMCLSRRLITEQEYSAAWGQYGWFEVWPAQEPTKLCDKSKQTPAIYFFWGNTLMNGFYFYNNIDRLVLFRLGSLTM